MSLHELQQELRGELKRISKKPGENFSSFMENFVQMPESDGLIVVRFLPSKTGRVRDLFCSTRLHTINNRRVHCRREIVGEFWKGNCPICDYYNYLWKESDKKPKDSDEQIALRTEAKGLKPNEKYYYNVVVKDQKGTFRNNQANKLNTPLILSIGKQLQAKVLRAMLGSEEDLEDPLGEIYSTETGRDFKILKKSKRDGDGRVYPFYDESKFFEPSVAGTPEEIEQWMASLHDLQALRTLIDPEEMKQLLRIHRGLEKDPNVSFDIRELEGVEVTAAPVQRNSDLPAKKSTATTQPSFSDGTTLSEEDAALLEADFLNSVTNEPK
jgi:hypothetical protein